MIRREPRLTQSLLSFAVVALAVGCGSSEKKGPEPTPGEKPKLKAPPKVDLGEKYARAVEYEKQGDFRNAYQAFLEIQGVDPDYKDLSERLEGYRDLVDLQREIEDLKSDPPKMRSPLHTFFAEELRKRGPTYRDQAKAQYETAIELDADNFDAHYGLATLHLEASQFDEAIRHFERAVEVESGSNTKNSDAYFQLAFLYRTVEGQQDAEKALENARLAVEYSAGDALGKRRMYAELLMQAGKKDEALAMAQDIVSRPGATEADTKRIARFEAGSGPAAPAPEEGAPEEAAPEESGG